MTLPLCEDGGGTGRSRFASDDGAKPLTSSPLLSLLRSVIRSTRLEMGDMISSGSVSAVDGPRSCLSLSLLDVNSEANTRLRSSQMFTNRIFCASSP
ncbi:hypothetical protein PsorP6_004167 [Peronosclerospora sorghi]|uniref:Uncharacterized protein n=1 Tax=Peronosclerospora sorghi TaxID=230839 RepID=A0ACC0VMA5_9STRA|nr:hypothetical protein PsorP6_004167 [Peronosclerospora sorghi]